MAAPAVSVIIATYNRPALLVQAIASVLRQTFADWEAVVVDDGSAQANLAAVEGLADSRLRYYYRENAGLAAAWNTGIALSSGPYVAFSDDDDLWLPNKLEAQVAVLDARPEAGLVTGGWLCVDEAGGPLAEVGPWIFPSKARLDLQTWLLACPSVRSAVMVRREWLERSGGFDERLRDHAVDWDMWLRLAHAGCPMDWARETVCAYRIHAGGMTQQASRQREGMIAVLDKFFARPDVPGEILAERAQFYAQAHLRGAAREYGAGQIEEARRDLARAIDLDELLMADNGEPLLSLLVKWATDPVVGEPAPFLSAVLGNLPAAATGLVKRRREAIARAAKLALFQARSRQDRARVWRRLVEIGSGKPRLLLDRGVASVAWQSLAGTRPRPPSGQQAALPERALGATR